MISILDTSWNWLRPCCNRGIHYFFRRHFFSFWNWKKLSKFTRSAVRFAMMVENYFEFVNTSGGDLVPSSNTAREIAPNSGANATKFFTFVAKSWKLVSKLATGIFHHNLTKRYSELKRFAKRNPRQTSSLSLFPKRSTCISIDNWTLSITDNWTLSWI